ncbi:MULTISPECIES: DinB family protein [Croceitalea]|uniref:DinB family protein n=1 Tax=Croceitalea vernalis TaxID=3075599 RepID=A0ABU3BEV4_9FLAO|nr:MULTISPECIES: DinB family protein [unclassified Croceitalea]MDT0538901.1 DinB family protein [Croceitalea sp. P059]MDT0620688.1 DinB family protein [Croceitalea sp. P007]
MEGFFNQLFDYNFYCNKKLIEQAVEFDAISDNTIKLFSHILNAHHIWNKRILKEESSYDVWQIHKVADWQDIHYENQRATFEIIRNNDDLNIRIDFMTTEGRSFANDLKDILFHIINHSTHHRGQILADFRSNNIQPLGLDYIHYKR